MKKSAWGWLFLFSSCSVSAQWLANIGGGESYNDNFSLQNGNYTNISQNRTTRTGTELSGGISWEQFSLNGGYSIDLQGMIDRDNNNGETISNLAVTANRVQPVSADWLLRYSGSLIEYDDQTYLANSFSGYSLEATLGYFGKHNSGMDLTLTVDNEDHNRDVNALYQTGRVGLRAVYFFPAKAQASRVNLMLGLERNDSNDGRRDANTLLASINWEQIRFGKNQAIISLSWKRDTYAQSYTITQQDQMSSFAPDRRYNQSSNYPSGNPSSGGSMGSSAYSSSATGSTSQVRVDSQYYLTATLQRPLSKALRASLSANAGYYSSETGDQSFVNLYARLRWYIQ